MHWCCKRSKTAGRNGLRTYNLQSVIYISFEICTGVMHSDFYSMFVARLLHEIGRNKYRIVNGGGCMKTVNRGRSPVTYEKTRKRTFVLVTHIGRFYGLKKL